MESNNFGILASIDWNSNQWKGLPTKEDIENSSYSAVKESGISYSCINFGHEVFPVEYNGYYAAILPQIAAKSIDNIKAKYVSVVFLKSHNYIDNQNYIIGFYEFPVLKRRTKESPLEGLAGSIECNLMALPNDIYLLENPVNLETIPSLNKYLPEGKEMGKSGFSFLSKPTVLNVLDEMSKANPGDNKLSGKKLRIFKAVSIFGKN
jgi:hypothetical protein